MRGRILKRASPDTTSTDEELVGLLASLRGQPCDQLVDRLRAAAAAMALLEQPEALAAAERAGICASSLIPRLQQAVVHDADDASGLAAALSELISSLSGQGEHTLRLAVRESALLLWCRPRGAGTGTRLWRASQLCAWACETHWAGLDLTGSRVLELGCGTAAAGLAAAALGAREVTLTDVDPAALRLAKRNAARNFLPNVRVAHLDAEASEASEAAAEGRFDLLLAADLVYGFVSPDRLAATAERLLEGPHARALFVHDGDGCRSEGARQGVAGFVAAVEAATALRCVRSETVDKDWVTGRELAAPLLLQLFAAPLHPN